ncbi:MAG: protein translocase subunit SecF [Maricaulaceae bacterium]
MLLKIIPSDTKIAFTKLRGAAFALSLVLLALAVGAFVTRGLNFGIDFTGGTQIVVTTPGPANLEEVRRVVGDLHQGTPVVQTFGAPNAVKIGVPLQPETDGEAGPDIAIADQVMAALEAAMPGVQMESSGEISGVVSGELVRAGAMAVGLALLAMLAYVWFRFEWQFSIGAVAALAHDVLLTIGMFSVTQIEFNLSIIAAILTIVGYSMNDTVVVYDRIRENMRKYKKIPVTELLDGAINDTLSRTTMTSVTTLIALIALYVLGGEVLRGFSFAMIWGVVIGTYSSIFIAAPILILTGVRSENAPSETKADPIVS